LSHLTAKLFECRFVNVKYITPKKQTTASAVWSYTDANYA